MVIQVRGNHGSGKSTAVRGLIDRFGIHQVAYANDVVPDWEKLASKPNEIVGYILNNDTFLMGPYERPTGGCDVVKKQEFICERARIFQALGYDVVFEGILASITYQRYADLADEIGRDQMWFGFLDTSKEQSFANINKRRESSTVVRGPFKEDLFDAKVKMLTRCRQRYMDEGYQVVDLPFGYGTDVLVDLLTK